MAPDFQRFMTQATRLTQAGDVAAATALIQNALNSRRFAADAEAPADGDVIDVVARVVPDSADADPAPRVEPLRDTATPGRFVGGRFGNGRAALDFKLFVPHVDGVVGPRPLVVMLHGCTQDPDDFAAGTRMNELADAAGVYVLYPAQSRSVNPQGCWNWFKANHQRRGRGEPAALAAMTRQVMAEHPIDATRVYAAGLSAGGAMAAILGREYPDLFAAVGVHSGLAPGAARDLPGALAAMKGGGTAGTAEPLGVPTIVFHGDADPTVHADNGARVFAAAPGERGAEQRDTVPGAGGSRRAASRTQRVDGRGRVVAEHWVVHGAAHAWSGGDRRGTHADPDGPDASAEMLRFFLAHRRGA